MIRILAGATFAFLLAATLVAQAPTPPSACDRLGTLALPDTTITRAETVAGPGFTPPGGRAIGNLPGFCRVAATSKLAVRFEVWLPLNGWNGKFQGVGNGANAGAISYDAMALALRRGYAVASTDTGHATTNGRDAQWAMGHPELLIDFAYRGLHITTEHAKTVVRTFYGQSATRSYYVGCSTGGRQGLMEAQRFPDDYDGLIAGAPAANWTRFQAGGHLWAVLSLNKDPESYVPASKLPIIEGAVNAACDAADGVTDGVLEDPRQCHFDAQALACKAGQDLSRCLTPKQAAAVNNIWNGPHNSKGQLVYPPYMRGAEAAGGWATYTTGKEPVSGSHWEQASNVFKYMVFENPAWDFRSFDYDRGVSFSNTTEPFSQNWPDRTDSTSTGNGQNGNSSDSQNWSDNESWSNAHGEAHTDSYSETEGTAVTEGRAVSRVVTDTDSESETNGTTIGTSKSRGTNWATSNQEGSSIGSGTTTNKATGRNTSWSAGVAESLAPIMKDLPTAVHSLQTVAHMAAEAINELPIGTAIVKTRSNGRVESAIVRIPLLVDPKEKYPGYAKAYLIERSPQALPIAEADKLIADRQEWVIAQGAKLLVSKPTGIDATKSFRVSGKRWAKNPQRKGETPPETE